MKKGKLIVFSAPSGSGKSTIIKKIRERENIPFVFSVSATNRTPRNGEEHGKDYYFLTDEEFRKHIDNGDFVEFCEVYPGKFYGTLKSEIIDKCNKGENVILDVDVEGGVNIKRLFGNSALTIFIMPPSIEELRARLVKRATDSQQKIDERIRRARYEISFSGNYDFVVNNDKLENAVENCERIIKSFLGK